MTAFTTWFTLALLFPAQAAPANGEVPILFPTEGQRPFPIATTGKEAQAHFDQGLTFYYGFNHAEAARQFRAAAAADPATAMPWWGLALAVGPNYNRDIDVFDEARHKQAYEAVQEAVKRSARAPAREQDYIRALAQRYSSDPKAKVEPLEVEYAKAMGELVKKYPDDIDAAVLHAEALMNLRPWKLWSPDRKPAADTLEILRVLESVLQRAPEHAGANHYYIHTMEASPHPERALTAAHRLLTLAPAHGHLVHMPGHIFIHTGDYELAAKANELGIQADEAFFKKRDDQGVYRYGYYPHNLHFLAFARSLQGRGDQAIAAADKLASAVGPAVKHMPMLEMFLPYRLFMRVRFQRWQEILQEPVPPPGRPLSKACRHYARGVALALTGKRKEAQADKRGFLAQFNKFPVDAGYGMNKTRDVLAVGSAVLEARLAEDPKAALPHWEKAVQLQDALNYGEPADWYYPVRESLGAALLRAGDAKQAERVFRADLERHRRNGRSLFGLRESLKAQGRQAEADLVDQQFRQVWQKAVTLSIEEL